MPFRWNSYCAQLILVFVPAWDINISAQFHHMWAILLVLFVCSSCSMGFVLMQWQSLPSFPFKFLSLYRMYTLAKFALIINRLLLAHGSYCGVARQILSPFRDQNLGPRNNVLQLKPWFEWFIFITSSTSGILIHFTPFVIYCCISHNEMRTYCGIAILRFKFCFKQFSHMHMIKW